MFTIQDENGIYQARDLDEAEHVLLSDLDVPAGLFDAKSGKRIPFTVERRDEGNVITYSEGIPSLGIAAGSQFIKSN